MQKTTKLITLVICCVCIGVLYYAWQQQWVIITFTTHVQNQSTTASSYAKKQATLYWWHLNRWATESVDMLWGSDESHNAQQLIQAVLTLTADEHIITKKVVVERVLIYHQTSQLLVFFDQSPFSKNMSIHTKLVFIESMLKTVRENGVKLSGIYFLVNNQPLNDQHLDFRQVWPIEGFCHTKS